MSVATAARNAAAGRPGFVGPTIKHNVAQRLDLTSIAQVPVVTFPSGTNTLGRSLAPDAPGGQTSAVRLSTPGVNGSSVGITLPTPWDLGPNFYLRVLLRAVTPMASTGSELLIRVATTASSYNAGNWHEYRVVPRATFTATSVNWLPTGAWVYDGYDYALRGATGTGANLLAVGYIVIAIKSANGQVQTMDVARLEAITKASAKAKCVFWHDDTIASGALGLSSRLAAYGWNFTEATEWEQLSIGAGTGGITPADARAYQDAGNQFGSHATTGAEHTNVGATSIIDQARRNRIAARKHGLRGGHEFAWWGGLGANQANLDAVAASYRAGRYNTGGLVWPEMIPPAMPALYKALLVSTGDTFTNNFKPYIDNGIKSRGVVSFVIHQDLAAPGGSNAFTTEIETTLAYLNTPEIRAVMDVVTADQAWAACT